MDCGYDYSDVIGTTDFMSPFLFPNLILILSLSSPQSHWDEVPIGLRLIQYIAWYINDR